MRFFIVTLMVVALVGCGDDASSGHDVQGVPDNGVYEFGVDPDDYSPGCLMEQLVDVEPLEEESDGQWDRIKYHDVDLSSGAFEYAFKMESFRACEDEFCGNPDASRGLVYEEEPHGVMVSMKAPHDGYVASTFVFSGGSGEVFSQKISDEFDLGSSALHETLIEFAPNAVLGGAPYTMRVEGDGQFKAVFRALTAVRFIDPACL